MRTNKNAFTLAETLITLGIMGVVVAMTMPAVINKARGDKLQAEFKKTYSELNQVAMKFYADNGISFYEYDLNQYNQQSQFAVLKKFVSYYKLSTTVPTSANEIVYFNLNGQRLTSNPCDRSDVLSVSGRYFWLDDNPGNSAFSYGPKICVDINGKNKPNKWGVDKFVFVFTNGNAVIPFSGDKWNTLQGHGKTSEEILKQYCSTQISTPAHSCAYFAIQNKSPDGNGDYWHDFLNGK